MNKLFTKLLSLIVCFSLCIAMIPPLSAEAATIGGVSLNLDRTETTITGKTQSVTATVELNVTDADTVAAAGMSLNLSLPENWTLESYVLPTGTMGSASATAATWFLMGGTTNVKTLVTLTLGIPADVAAGTYNVAISNVKVNDGSNATIFSNGSASATITVKEAAPVPTSDYSIYYELNDGKSDSDGNAHYEYKVDDTVTAEVFIVSNQTDITLQAYDIYLSHDSNLSYQGQTLTSGVAYTTGDQVKQLTHIQAVGSDTQDTTKPISISLEKGKAVSLGTITFEVLDSAVFGRKMPITLTVGESGEGLTNIGVGNATSGNPTSYYPQNTGTVEGVEIMDTHTVSFNTDGGNPAIENKTVGHNLTATKPADPKKAGYEFAGWCYTEDGQEKEFDFTKPITQNVELTAKWTESTANYTVKHWQQNVADDNYTEVETDRLTLSGVTGEPTAAEAKTNYEGFTAQTFEQKEITADGNTVVNIYYTRNSYTLTWNDGTNTTTEQVKYGATIEVPATNPEKTGYAFDGWDPTLLTTMPAEDTTITAKWTPITYTVTYNGNGNTSGTMSGSTFTYDADGKLTANAFAKTGYTFNGWNTSADGSGTSYANEAEVKNWASKQDATIELFAQWKANTYTVTFNANGGSGDTMESQNFEYDKAQTLKKNTYTNEGYSFAGWSYGGKTYSDEASVLNLTDVNGASVEMLAQWTKQNTIKVIADSTKGSATTTPISAIPEQTVTVNITPNPGYEVDTVTYVKEGSEETFDATKVNDTTYTFSMPDGNAVVTVTFTAIPYEVTVTNPADGTGTVGVTGTTEDGKATVGTVITLTNEPAKGYELKQYIVDGTPVDGNTFTMPAKAVTVTAEFQPIEYTITYDLAGGALAEGVTNPTTYDVTTEAFTLYNPTKVGYTFAGWTGSNGDTAQTTVTIEPGTVVGNLNYTATWTPDKVGYTVNHWQQKVGGGTEQNNTNFELKEAETLKDYTDSSVTPAVKSYNGFKAPATQTVTIQADSSTVVDYYYTRETYTITYKPDGGSDVEKGSYTHGTPVTELPTPTKPGYDFDGWYDENNNKVQGITAEDYGNKELTAKWAVVTYTITFNTDGGNEIADMSYDITKTVTLPTPTKAYYVFKGWKLTENHGKWTAGTYNVTNTDGTTAEYKEMYGIKDQKMQLVAQWERMTTPVVEEYKYAADGFWMIRVDAGALTDTQEYQFNNQSMYYMEKQADGSTDSYMIENGTAVFYTLIPVAENGVTYIDTANSKLTDEGYNKLSIADCTTRSTITYDGRINDDEVINIADANIVYQMTLYGGKYYGSLTTEQRLAADMDKAAAEKRASIADVNKIVNIINGVN